MKVAADEVLASFKEIRLDQIQALEIPLSSIDGETTANQRNEFLTLDRTILFGTNPGCKDVSEFPTQKLFRVDVKCPPSIFPTPLLFTFSRRQDGRPVAAGHQTLEAWTGGALDGSWAGCALTHSPNVYLLFCFANQNSHVEFRGITSENFYGLHAE